MNEKIDWNEAPEGFDVHIDWGDRGGHFYREEPTRYVRDGGYFAIKSGIPTDGVMITRRPIAWDGKGNPPIGTRCEHQGSRGWENAMTVEVIAHRSFKGHSSGIE